MNVSLWDSYDNQGNTWKVKEYDVELAYDSIPSSSSCWLKSLE